MSDEQEIKITEKDIHFYKENDEFVLDEPIVQLNKNVDMLLALDGLPVVESEAKAKLLSNVLQKLIKKEVPEAQIVSFYMPIEKEGKSKG